MHDKIKAIAEYDGWEKREHQPTRGRIIFDNSISSQWLDTLEHSYLTDLNTIHPVAMRVLDELETEFIKTNKYDAVMVILPAQIVIKQACHTKPNESGQYIALVDAVYNGILLLNELKEKCSPHK